MAGAPRFKVYNPAGVYISACKHVEDAAALCALNGDGTTIRDGHRSVVWTEGAESDYAHESYDNVARTVYRRIDRARASRR